MNFFRRNDDEGGMPYFAYHITVFLLEMVLMVFGMIVVAWFSRQREFRADAGGARIAGRDRMVGALEGLRRTLEIVDPAAEQHAALQTLKISGRRSGFAALFASHPPLEERIERLRAAA
jgi:heat shock protein HtpX